jgi:hypothetical protein
VSGEHLYGSLIDDDLVGERLLEPGVGGAPFGLPALNMALNVTAGVLFENL